MPGTGPAIGYARPSPDCCSQLQKPGRLRLPGPSSARAREGPRDSVVPVVRSAILDTASAAPAHLALADHGHRPT